MQFHIKNQQGQLVGVADVQTSGSAIMEGRFEPSPEFDRYAPVLREREQAAKDSAGLPEGMDGLGWYAVGPQPLPASAAIEALRVQGDRILFRLAPPDVGITRSPGAPSDPSTPSNPDSPPRSATPSTSGS